MESHIDKIIMNEFGKKGGIEAVKEFNYFLENQNKDLLNKYE